MSIKLIGIELEGGWDSPPPDEHRRVHDGSVRVASDWFSGEIPSPTFEPSEDWPTWVENNYPDHVGISCGMHIHMSFEDNINAFADLMENCKLYERYLLFVLYRWGNKNKVKNKAFWNRVNGYNEYCTKKPIPNCILEYGPHVRYKIINFAAIKKHETIEIRVLPMFRSKLLAISAIQTILLLTNKFLQRKTTNNFDKLVSITCLETDQEEKINQEVFV